MGLVFLINFVCALTGACAPSPNSLQPKPLEMEANSESIRLARSHSVITDEDFSRDPPPVVTTSIGEIRGRYMTSRSGRRIAAFQGIPYAMPPVGELRFRNPVPLDEVPWSGVLIANKTGPDCLQLDFTKLFQVRGREDCLKLNIYAPADLERDSKQLLPVLVFLHGGGWMSHTSSIYGPRYLLDHNVILATFNFRLGVLGFLSTGDSAAPGNFGLRDQATAFKWLVKHLPSFGGDPKKITLIGESTGAFSVGFHLISPVTSKFFKPHGAILLSGGPLNHAAIMNDTFSNTKILAKRLMCPTHISSQRLVNCLRHRDPYMVVGQQLHLWRIPTISRLLFGPVLEDPQDNPHPFLKTAPEVAYLQGTVPPVPILAGMDLNEGGLFAANVYLVPFLFRAINNDLASLSSYAMAFDNLEGVNASQISKAVNDFYLGGAKWSYHTRDRISAALGDRTITHGVYKLLRAHSAVAPTYGFVFAHSSTNFSLLTQQGLRGSEWGVSHGDELPFIFSLDSMEEFTSTEDLHVSTFLSKVIANFATEAQPLPQNVVSENTTWSPVLNPKYLELLQIDGGNGGIKMIPFPFENRMKFWDGLHLN